MLLMAWLSIGAYAQTNRLSIPGITMSRGSEATLSVFMDNVDEVTAVEFTLEVPQDFTVNPQSATLAERTKNHQITARKLNNGKYKFVVLSDSNAPIDGIAGLLFTVRVKSAASVSDEGDYPMVISSAVMSVKSGANVLQESQSGKIVIKSMPNLHVVSLNCSEPVAGRPLTVTWKVRNDGHGATGDTAWKDYIWLVPNISVGTSMVGSKLLATAGNVSALASGESYENTLNVTLDERIYGNYDLVVTSNMYGVNDIDFTNTGGEPPVPYDPDNAEYGFLRAKGDASYVTVFEENEYNGLSDNFFYKRIDIQVPPLADIQVPSVVVNIDNSDYETSDDGVLTYNGNGGASYMAIAAVMLSGQASNTAFYSGKKVKVTATIQNKGGADITNTRIKNMMYISSTPTLGEGQASLLAVGSEYISLNVGESTSVVFGGYIPIDWYGETYFIVLADVDDAVYELANTENNVGSTGKVDVLLTPGPDFEPYDISVPKQISSGASFDVKYSVRNIGPGAPVVSEWKDKVYISSKSTGLDDSAVCIGEITRKGTFSSDAPSGKLITGYITYVGDTYTNDFAVKINQTLPVGTYYIYVKVDGDADVFEYDGEDNNVVMSQPVILSNPDLTAELLTISEETLITNNKVAVSWKLKNVGTSDIVNGEVMDAFYASSNPNGSNAIKIAEVTNTISLVAGGEKTLRANITIPKNSALSGNLYFFVKTNDNGGVIESNTSNNSSNSILRTFEYVSNGNFVNGLNLSIGDLIVNEQASPGEVVSVSYVITNNGTETIDKNVKQEVFFSKSKTFDSSARACSVTGTLPDVTGLKSLESLTANVSITIPTDMKGGENVIYVVINSDKSLLEKNTNDNQAKSPIYVNGNLPNLVVSDLVVPAEIMTSEKTEVSWPLGNIGSWEADGVRCVVYLSTDAVISGNDKVLASVYSSKLAKGSTEQMKATIELADDVVGTRYVIVKANTSNIEESTMDDNYVFAQFTAKQSPLPDLAISDLSTEGTIRGGQPVTIKAMVTNNGDSETHSDKWTDVFYLSKGYTLDVDKAIKIGSKTHVGKLENGGTYDISADFTIPATVKGYYVLFAVTDGTASMIEKNKNNNQAKITVFVEDPNDTPADLAVTKMVVPSRIMAGESVTISYNIVNQGEFAAKGTLRDVLYMSKDNHWDENDAMVGVVTGNVNIEAGTEITRNVTGRITNMPEGNYYLIVRTNSTHAIAESDYDNNQSTAKSACSMAFQTLALGNAATVNTSGLFKLPLHSGLIGKTVGLYLSMPENTSAGLYTAFERVPSTACYERSASDIEATEQEVLIPDVQEGNYYILAQDNAAISRNLNEFVIDGEQELNETAMVLSAREVQFGASTLSIKEGGNNGWISTEIHGALLDSIMDFRLAREGGMIPAESITFYDQTSTRASFNLNDAAIGSYDIVSELPNGTQATLPDGFKVVPGVNANLGVKIDAPHWTHIDSPVPVSIAYANGGNTDIVLRGLLFSSEGGDVGMTIEDLKKHEHTLSIKPKGKSDSRGFITIPPGTQETINCYFKQYKAGVCYLKVFVIK